MRRREFVGVLAGLAIPLAEDTEMPEGRRIGKDDLDSSRRHTARLRRLDNVLGGADTFAVYAAEVTRTTTLLDTARYTEPIGAGLRSLLAEQAQLAGWAAFDAGYQNKARQYFLDSHKAAEDAGDSPLAGNALAFVAYQQTSQDVSAVKTAEASYETARKTATPRVGALLLERKAWSHAKAGEARDADTALALAREALLREPIRPEPDWVFWVDETEVDIMSGRCWTELRRPLRAVPVLESALSRFDETQARDKALYSTWLAMSYVHAGEVERAADVATHAFDLANGVASVRPLVQVRKVGQALTRHREVPEVAAFLKKLSAS